LHRRWQYSTMQRHRNWCPATTASTMVEISVRYVHQMAILEINSCFLFFNSPLDNFRTCSRGTYKYRLGPKIVRGPAGNNEGYSVRTAEILLKVSYRALKARRKKDFCKASVTS
jgi:hypothetical protein